jgi:hypothetical protein
VPMKKWTPAAVLLATAALAVTTALPASAATTTVAVPDATQGVAVDVVTGRVYVGTEPTPPPETSPFDEWVSSAGVAQVDGTTKKVVKSATLLTSRSAVVGYGVYDIEVSPVSNDLWVLVGNGTIDYQCGGDLYQLDKRSLKTVRVYDVGCAKTVELDPTSRSVYLLAGSQQIYVGNDDYRPEATLVAVNGATGGVRRVDVTSDGGWGAPGQQPVTTVTTFNPRNQQLYVGKGNAVAVYTTKLALARTVKVSHPVDTVAVNPLTNLVYATDGAKLTEVSGRTNTVTRTAALSGASSARGREAVIDVGANVLYLGTNTIRLSTLRLVAQQPFVVQAVNPLTHARYAVAPGHVYVGR